LRHVFVERAHPGVRRELDGGLYPGVRVDKVPLIELVRAQLLRVILVQFPQIDIEVVWVEEAVETFGWGFLALAESFDGWELEVLKLGVEGLDKVSLFHFEKHLD